MAGIVLQGSLFSYYFEVDKGQSIGGFIPSSEPPPHFAAGKA
ncbi:hypothetical protein EYZ11_002843 [Aspergillus tanneri]|uniref:Uncharacterized protein n=1 Tax=Aspergillus tanneri TaxID=1220188 RepID=A0A4S3JQF5_9EURO|nr:hypothetical protein EYZ11_002843 [Aspergillus tanneri]